MKLFEITRSNLRFVLYGAFLFLISVHLFSFYYVGRIMPAAKSGEEEYILLKKLSELKKNGPSKEPLNELLLEDRQKEIGALKTMLENLEASIKEIQELKAKSIDLEMLLDEKSALIKDKDHCIEEQMPELRAKIIDLEMLLEEKAALIKDKDHSITLSIEEKNPEPTNKEEESKCSRIFLLLPHLMSLGGHGSQINNYLMAIAVATFYDRSMLLLEPPLGIGHPGGSQFGCPADSFEGKVSATNFSSAKMRENFPMGFSRLFIHPQWLSRGCKMPCVDRQYSYLDWQRIARSPENQVICTDPQDGSTTDVVVFEGHRLRALMPSLRSFMYARDGSVDSIDQAKHWAHALGAKANEASYFEFTINDQRQIDDYVLGLINRSGFLKIQPWIERDINSYLGSSFDLPMDEEYSAIHVRRGDKLLVESRGPVIEYWREQGYDDINNLPKNYIPFVKYLAAWDGPEVCPKNDKGELQIVKHHVYVATDDPLVIRQEIAELSNHVGDDPNTVVWNTCHEIKFYFAPKKNSSSFHIYEAGAEDSCFDQYHRNIVSMADLLIIAKAKTCIVEYNSNWGRLIYALRMQLNIPVVNSTDGVVKEDLAPAFSKDMRVGWGGSDPGRMGE